MGYKVSREDMDNIFSRMKERYKIYAPKRGLKYIRYGEINALSEIVYDEKSDFSPKEVFYPIVQTLLYFTEDTCTESAPGDARDILLFLRPCDMNGIRRLDTMFLKNGGQADNFYARLREKVKFIMMECREGFETCFCVSMGTNEARDYSAAVRFDENGVFLDVKDPELTPWFLEQPENDFKPEFIRENEKHVRVPQIPDRSMLKSIHALDFWHSFDEKCISCGSCNTVCITCSCFDTADIIYNETSRDGERRRMWSSCMLDNFTTMAGGHGVRGSAGERMRFKTMHKIYDFKARFGEENMCVGCGRCDMRCPKDIHFSETIDTLAGEMEKLKDGKVKES